MDRLTDAATILLAARADPARLLDGLPAYCRPANEAEGYRVQQAVAAQLGPVGGWKVGAPHPDGHCTCAPLPATTIVDSPARWPEASTPLRGIEAEIAFRFGADLPARDLPYTRAELVAAIASCHPLIEVLQSRFAHPDGETPATLLADSLSHGGLVVGPAVPDWQAIDFAAETVVLTIDGAEVKRRTANPAGDMMRLLLWMADTGTRWAGGLKAGQIVTCGSWTGKDYTKPGGTAHVAFGHAGTVELAFA